MDTATGVFLIAIGAILRFAVEASIQGISLHTIGVILMVAGAVIILIGLFRDALWSDRLTRRRREPAVVEERVDPRY